MRLFHQLCLILHGEISVTQWYKSRDLCPLQKKHVICTMSVTNIIHVIYVQITWFIAQNKALGQRYRCGHTTRPRKHNLRYKPGPPYFFESCTECTQQIIKRFNNEPGISQNNVGTRVWGNIWLHKTWRSQQGGNRCWTAYGWYK